ncbi:MAG: MmcQ/YjbR family DNA-binding protein [Proteobacteria bacterium]|nr:MmcQ/YjbR family DNA-binding protein [Pseudomonadota bacterium]
MSKIVVAGARAKAVDTFLEGRPGAEPFRMSANVTMYKVKGKIFAIHSRAGGYVVLKCDPVLIDMLKAKYSGIGHKTHLDPRYWIAVETDTDVPVAEFRKLAAGSHALALDGAKPKKKAKKNN